MGEVGGKAQASEGICSFSKEMSAPELLSARGLICNRFSSIAASVPVGGPQALSIPRLLLAAKKIPSALQSGQRWDGAGACGGARRGDGVGEVGGEEDGGRGCSWRRIREGEADRKTNRG